MPLAYDRSGRGATLVLLHPLGADRHVWRPVVDRLRGEREIITVDLPGFGASPPLPDGPPHPGRLAEAVAAHLAELGVERPHVAGNSLGGWVALELGLAGLARSVTGIAPAGLWPEPLVPTAGLAQRAAHALLPLVGPVAATGAGRWLLLRGSVAHPGRVPQRDAAHLVRSYALAPGFTAANDAMRAGRFDGLERIRVPVTLVWPDHDRLIRRPVWVPDRITNVVLRDSGHVPMWDAPEPLARILIQASGGRSEGDAQPGAYAPELAES